MIEARLCLGVQKGRKEQRHKENLFDWLPTKKLKAFDVLLR